MADLAFFILRSFGRGVERVAVTLAPELTERGDRVDVAVGGCPAVPTDYPGSVDLPAGRPDSGVWE